MPMAKLRSLVGMQAGVDAMGDMLQMPGEIEDAGRCIDRVAVDHHQRVDRGGQARNGFSDVKTGAALAWRVLAAPLSPGSGTGHLMRPRTEQVMAETHDHIALIEAMVRPDRAAKSQRHRRVLASRSDRLE